MKNKNEKISESEMKSEMNKSIVIYNIINIINTNKYI